MRNSEASQIRSAGSLQRVDVSARAHALDMRHGRKVAQRAHGASDGGLTGRSKR
jgi:hypothetical protein